MAFRPVERPADWEPCSPLDIATFRAAVVWTALWAVNFPHGEQKRGDRANFVTNGINRRSVSAAGKLAWSSGNSSCGDLWHFVLYVIGFRGKYINRDAPGCEYTNGWNLIWAAAHPAFHSTKKVTELKAGDLIRVGDRNDSNSLHVMVIVKDWKPGEKLCVAQYGGTLYLGTDGRYSEYPSDVHKDDLGRLVRGVGFDGERYSWEKSFDEGKTWKRYSKPLDGVLDLEKAIEWQREKKLLDSEVWLPPGFKVP